MENDLSSTDPILLNDEALRQRPLPMPSSDADKEERGRVMIIGGSREIPGAVLLAANAALHAGAGKVMIATASSIAFHIAVAIPESRVIALPETSEGGILDCDAVGALDKALSRIDAVLIGPGMQDEAMTCRLVECLLPKLGGKKLILDAYAMSIACRSGLNADSFRRENNPVPLVSDRRSGDGFFQHNEIEVLLTPHAGEMAHLTGIEKKEITADPASAAQAAAQRWNATVALKGGTTYIATPSGRLWRHEGGNIGLAVSGSGDTLAGIVTALAARGASLEQACAWGVALHARAGERLASRMAPLGYLARDISAEVPALMHQLSSANAE